MVLCENFNAARVFLCLLSCVDNEVAKVFENFVDLDGRCAGK
ncbi:hypothetical protein Hbal_2500 [Hirschia baltica ATCC 49814]|uniref:Uncharacterized protein n=1 Tax=Hirschia baltica (strain ATCC 49814 / DSM 5838 / IFAM 1418) TaxID=582402 RepID=C6XNZ5_HIRBI|nr:hypothetical protein Hbal_2500 [Hirschia baltica ATCC 49814]